MILLGAAAVAFGANAGVVDRIAAIVGDDIVSLSEIYELAGSDFFTHRCPSLEDRCVTEGELEVLDALVRRVLIRQELQRLNIDVTAAEVDQQIDAMVRQYALPDRQALRDEVEKQDIRWDQYRDELLENLRSHRFGERVLASRVSLREDELVDEYNRSSRDLKRPYAQVSALGIPTDLASTPEEQDKMHEQIGILVTALRDGHLTWDDAVAQYDAAGVSSMFSGRDFAKGSLVEPVDAVVFSSPVGEIADPVLVGNVWYVIRVDSRGEKSEAASYEEAKERLRQQVFDRKIGEAEEEWYQRARREAAIDVKLKVE